MSKRKLSSLNPRSAVWIRYSLNWDTYDVRKASKNRRNQWFSNTVHPFHNYHLFVFGKN